MLSKDSHSHNAGLARRQIRNKHVQRGTPTSHKFVKRQDGPGRRPLTSDADEEETSTTLALGRGSALPTADDDDDDDETTSSSTRRARTSTSSSSAATRAPLTPIVTNDPNTSTTSTTSSSTSSSSTTTRRLVTPVSSTSTTASSTQSTTSPVTSATSGITDTSSSNDASGKSSSGSNTGVIAGVVIALLAVLAIAAFFGFRFWKKKKNAKLESEAAMFPYGGAPGDKAGSGGNGGYNQHLDSYDDLQSAAHGNEGGYGAANQYNGEKGYGTMGTGGIDNEKTYGNMSPYGAAAGAGAAGAGIAAAYGAMSNGQRSPEVENFAGRGLTSPYSQQSLGHFQSHHSLLGPQSNSPNVNGNGIDSYPPTPQTGYGNVAPSSNGMYGGSPAMNSQFGGPGAGSAAAAAAAAAALGAGAGIVANNDPNAANAAGPFEDPAHEGKVYIVTRVFEPSMPDELAFYPGDKIQIVVSYDDGWCLGCNLSSSERDGQPPARGVFPRDCVEDYTQEHEQAAQNAASAAAGRPLSVDADQPLNGNQNVDLQRAPTLPPLDIAQDSRFSIGSGGNSATSATAGRPASLIPGNTAALAAASVASPNSARNVPLPEEDPYGGFSEDPTSPVNQRFAPNVQVSGGADAGNVNANRQSVPQFGSSYNIADYASRLDNAEPAMHVVDSNTSAPRDSTATTATTTSTIGGGQENRLSTLNEENSQMLDEFPSTPQTITSGASPRFSGFPPTLPNNNIDNNRLSVAASSQRNRLSTVSGGMSNSPSVKSLKRTSSLVAPKDADLLLSAAASTPMPASEYGGGDSRRTSMI